MDEIVQKALQDVLKKISRSKSNEDFFNLAVNAFRHEQGCENELISSLKLVAPELDIRKQECFGCYRGDISIYDGFRWLGQIEVKAPMTNHDGIRNKTRHKNHLPKDSKCLREASKRGVKHLYSCFFLFEVYALDDIGNTIPPEGKSVRDYEKKVKDRYGIKWPTRHDYTHGNGEAEVCCAAEGLGFVLLANWNRIRIPSACSNIVAYIDSAAFKLNFGH